MEAAHAVCEVPQEVVLVSWEVALLPRQKTHGAGYTIIIIIGWSIATILSKDVLYVKQHNIEVDVVVIQALINYLLPFKIQIKGLHREILRLNFMIIIAQKVLVHHAQLVHIVMAGLRSHAQQAHILKKELHHARLASVL